MFTLFQPAQEFHPPPVAGQLNVASKLGFGTRLICEYRSQLIVIKRIRIFNLTITSKISLTNIQNFKSAPIPESETLEREAHRTQPKVNLIAIFTFRIKCIISQEPF
jgi:hypothetical protein